MGSLLYRPDWEEARSRLTAWWHGGDIGRPVMQITAPRAEPVEEFPPMPVPEGWQCNYSTVSLDYKVHVGVTACAGTLYLGEACPTYPSGDLAPNCLALFLGCQGRETPQSVWCEPCIEDPEAAVLAYNPDNFYWRFCLDTYRRVLPLTRGKCLQTFPDLIEGLDTLAALRRTDRLLLDLVDRPEWVAACMRRLTDLYFRYYDVLYDMLRDEGGGSPWWIWGPGRTCKIQCDMSAMIAPDMFREFMVPLITEMTERASYSLYHFDGPGAVQHEAALRSIPDLDMIQWVPGAGNDPAATHTWWPMYHRILDAGKKVMISVGGGIDDAGVARKREDVAALKREFGGQFGKFALNLRVGTAEQAGELIRLASM